MSRTRARRWAASIALGALAGCAGDAGAPDAAVGPSVREVASVLLADTDSLPLGNLLEHTRGSDGTIYVGDVNQGTVHAYAPDGTLRRVIGKMGSGPGELRSLGKPQLLPGDSLLSVVDIALQRMSLFRAADGAFVKSFATPARGFGGTWTVRGDTATMGVFFESFLVGEWMMSDSVFRVFGKTPERMLKNPFALLSHGRGEVVRLDTLLVAALPTEPGLSLMNRQGAHTGFVRVPVARRRGPPDDLFDLMNRESGVKGDGPPPGYKIRSAMMGFGLRPDGAYMLLHMDADVDPPTAQLAHVAKEKSLKLWVSLVAADFARACVDAALPIESIDVPFVHLRGDTVDVVARRLEGDAPATRIHSFVVSAEGCDWRPTGGVVAPRP